MKKYGICLLTLCLAGCTASAPENTATATAAAAQKASIWMQEPDMDLDEAGDLPVFNYSLESASTTSFGSITLYIETEKTGYPGEWNGYSADAMLVEKNNKQGIETHDGTELFPISINKVNTPYVAGIVAAPYKAADGKIKVAYGAANAGTKKAQIFNADLKSVSEVDVAQFTYDFALSERDPFLAYQGDTLGVAGVKLNASGAMTGWAFDKYTPTSIKENMIVPVIDEQFVSKGYVIIAPDGTKIGDLNDTMKYRVGSYINGCYVISDGTYASIVDAASGSNIATQYQDAKYFENGYAPVKKDGKWGYIDQTGKEVTDFIFDDACTVYNGYAWVRYNDKYGILDFTNTLNDFTKQINAYWCSSCNEEAIGSLTVNISDLTIRDGSAVDANEIGISMEGAVYPVFEIQKDDDYTWYRINEENWVASEGTWASYEAAK